MTLQDLLNELNDLVAAGVPVETKIQHEDRFQNSLWFVEAKRVEMIRKAQGDKWAHFDPRNQQSEATDELRVVIG